MLHWMSRLGVWGQNKEKLDEYLYIYKYVSAVLLKEVSASMYLYGEAMAEVVDRKAELLHLPPQEIINRDRLTWSEISNLGESLEDVCLLTLKPVDPRQTKKKIFAQMKKTCEMILAVYCDLIEMRSESFLKIGPELDHCANCYKWLVSDLYRVGTGDSQGSGLRWRMRENLRPVPAPATVSSSVGAP